MVKEKKKVDVVITMGTCGSYVAQLLDAKIVKFSATGPFDAVLGTGNALNPFVHPFIFGQALEPMTIIERMSNTGFQWIVSQYFEWIAHYEYKHVKQEFPSMPETHHQFERERTVLALVNSHFVTHGPWPSYQNAVEIGGIHCKPGEDLPPDLKEFMDSNPEGVVLVSFGSTLSASQMTQEQQLIFRESFEELGVPIIWKWDGVLAGMPKNVFVKQWLPQNDLLAHPNLKAFVTHGGLLSLQEAIYHSVPLVGIPLGSDQQFNMKRAEKVGYAVRLQLQTLTKDELLSGIRKALSDKEMSQTVKTMRKLFTDHSLKGKSPKQMAISAINYIIDDQVGPSFMKPHKDVLSMSFHQVHGYDILAMITTGTLIALVISWKFLQCCATLWCGSKKSKQD